MNPERQPVLTAGGIVCALGLSPQRVWERFRRGETGIRPLERIREPWMPIRFGGEVTGEFRPGDHAFHRKMLKVMTWPVRFGVGAARLAVQEAGGEEALFAGVDPTRRGMFTGAGLSVDEDNEFLPGVIAAEGPPGVLDLPRFGREGVPTVNPLWLVKGLTNNVLALVAQGYDLQGPNDNLGSGRAGGLLSLHDAAHAIAEDRGDVLLAGGYDTLLHMEKLAGLFLLHRLPPEGTLPWSAGGPLDPGSEGIVPGEGAAFVVVEPEARARARGARVWARVRGTGAGFIASEEGKSLPVALGVEVLDSVTDRILAHSGVDASQVGLILSANSGDPSEAAIHQRWMEKSGGAREVIAPASFLGDGWAAGGAFALALALPALQEGNHRFALVTSLSDTGEVSACLLERG